MGWGGDSGSAAAFDDDKVGTKSERSDDAKEAMSSNCRMASGREILRRGDMRRRKLEFEACEVDSKEERL